MDKTSSIISTAALPWHCPYCGAVMVAVVPLPVVPGAIVEGSYGCRCGVMAALKASATGRSGMVVAWNDKTGKVMQCKANW